MFVNDYANSAAPCQPEPPVQSPKFPFNVDLQKMTSGKQLLLDDLPFSREELQIHYENGLIMYRKGIEFSNGRRPTCIRCGNQDLAMFAHFPCARCGEDQCTYCRKCLMMGRISSCTELISWAGPPLAATASSACSAIPPDPNPNVPTPLLAWSGKLSEGQHKASDQVVDCIERGYSAERESSVEQGYFSESESSGEYGSSVEKGPSELLVWAVCGAGKTEVLFAGIERALTHGQRVCIATPRTDVVLELTPRLQAAFPTIPIASLYGGSPDRHLYAPLTISTTHQLLRFYHAFDTVIVDEVDAFPFSVDETLQYAVKQARKPNSSLIFLTATPNQKWQKQCRTGKRDYVTIPARFHRQPLPVPEFVWCGNWEKQLKQKKLPQQVLIWIKKRLDLEKQVLLFIPKISLINVMLPYLQAEFTTITVEGVHSEDPNRKEKVQKMRNREVSLLLTTTILERGVTFPNIDVAVLGAEDRIFSESALVQIAGRVGRSPNFPSGNITFFHYGKTETMVKARRQIMNMNTEAKKKGLID